MYQDSVNCPDCGRLVELDGGEEIVCICGRSLYRNLTSKEALKDDREVFLLACPKCGSQRKVRGEWIGKTDLCECGQKYCFTLILAKVPPDPDGMLVLVMRHVRQCWNATVEFSQREIFPRLT